MTGARHGDGRTGTPAGRPRSLWFSVGAFLGHVGRAIVSPAPGRSGGAAAARRTTVEERPAESPVPGTRAVARRTTTEELIIEPLEDRSQP